MNIQIDRDLPHNPIMLH